MCADWGEIPGGTRAQALEWHADVFGNSRFGGGGTASWASVGGDGTGVAGKLSLEIRKRYLEATTGKAKEYEHWLTYAN